MADDPNTDASPVVTETDAAEPVVKSKRRMPRKKTVPKRGRVATGSEPTPPAEGEPEHNATKSADRRRKYTPAERASILASIEKATRGGKTTLKAALRQAEVSEQTYYNWKNAASKKESIPSAGLSDDDLATLVALEAENLKLRRELAAKLRAENEELRRRLGLA